MRRSRCLFFVVVLIFAAGICPRAAADPISKFIDPSLFGHLDQHKTKCPTKGCGGTAVLNSIVFLQNEYASVYQGLLTGPDESEQITTANQIDDDMQSSEGKDTSWSNFVSGKEQYINGAAPGTTSYSDESVYDPKPVIPTPGYIVNQLAHDQDVEILVEGLTPKGGHFGHYVTVTGMSYDASSHTGMFSFVDPADGMNKTRDFYVDEDGYMDFLAANGLSRYISGAVSEGPTGTAPEPTATALVLSGSIAIVVISGARRQRARLQSKS